MDEDLLNGSQLKDLTYPVPRIDDFLLDDNLPAPRGKIPADNAPLHIIEAPKFELGVLDTLPLELLQISFSMLDLSSLAALRCVNRRAVEVVESIPQYKAIIAHAPKVLRAASCIGTGRWISCDTLYEKLCTANCEECGDFGGYLYILTCKRVCFLCISQNKKYLPLRRSHAIRKFGLNRQIVDTLRCMRSLPGTYSPNERRCSERIVLVDRESACRAGTTLHGSFSAMEQYVSDTSAAKLEEFNKRIQDDISQKAAVGSKTPRRRRPQTEDPFDGLSGNPLRFMAIVRVPWLNKVSSEAEWGFHCIGCAQYAISRPLHFRRKFTAASFTEHLRECDSFVTGIITRNDFQN
ncbi:uncharacterized protein EI97DRAFT_39340 [Westerdykella ornata]|uniref:F-box domain-containing protein n=1 Tax=Westerdykella ornata TaxID=318751 RepID=A0A6A6JIM6_WESOR|nr:uncharacterized protein EI97DRAFT_39340 [Westerdykella ornata]KAF2276421.1 hypothetical protein EI97DRAFT_39340 [Westerdykella ornata]